MSHEVGGGTVRTVRPLAAAPARVGLFRGVLVALGFEAAVLALALLAVLL